MRLRSARGLGLPIVVLVAALPVNNTCEMCDCGGCPSCAVCGRGIATVLEIHPGGRHEWSWDGRTWEVVQGGCSTNLSCEQEHVVAAGAQLRLDVTYSFSFAVNTSFGANDEFIGTPQVVSVAFVFPLAQTIELAAVP